MSAEPERAARGAEPTIAVGLVSAQDQVKLRLLGPFLDATGERWPAGDYLARRHSGDVRLTGPRADSAPLLELRPERPEHRFCVEATIGIDFHWQQTEEQTFPDALRLLAEEGGVTLINDVALETYLSSVICSEMNAASPAALLRAHAVISRSWLLAQVRGSLPAGSPVADPEAHIRWYDREAHARFDVCADDHCQRYQGLTRIASSKVAQAVEQTRGLVLSSADEVCDARFSKCCGGVVEGFSAAWQDLEVPYLVPLTDAAEAALPEPPLTDEAAFRRFVDDPPAVHCNCSDPAILSTILPSYDQATADFFRWQQRVDAAQATAWILDKGGLDLGRLLALEPVARATSGRLVRLRLVGERASAVVGKELEIRRLLSSSHLYSSAFYVEPQGPAERPDAFLLHGAGWGHGVGLCQIGAAVMAAQEQEYQEILTHYYPSATLESWYP